MERDFVKPIAGILTADPELLPRTLERLERFFGPADIVGEWRPFDHTRYYEEEMGAGLLRTFVSFEKLQPPEGAAGFKREATAAEDKFRCGSRRTVNIDPGYLDANKVVLLTGKRGGHRIALAPGIFADLLLRYDKGWVALPWAFPDFSDGGFFPLFTRVRTRFKEQVRYRWSS